LLFPFKDGFAGRSPGKWLFGLQVVRRGSLRPVGFLRSLRRNLLLAIPVLQAVVALIIAYDVWQGEDRLGDGWAGTRVIWRKYARELPFAPRGIQCVACGYNLTGNVSGRCPECGTTIPDHIQDVISLTRVDGQA
jgi:hypothetical protein